MIEAARERLGDDPRVELLVADLTELDVAPVDAILSTATFHWIGDHALLFARLRAALHPGGRLVAQCGGEGNIAAVHAAAAGGRRPGALRAVPRRLGRALALRGARRDRAAARAPPGSREARAWLEERPVTPEDPHAYLREINLGAHLEQLPEDLREGSSRAVRERLEPPGTIGYVRLNIDAPPSRPDAIVGSSTARPRTRAVVRRARRHVPAPPPAPARPRPQRRPRSRARAAARSSRRRCAPTSSPRCSTASTTRSPPGAPRSSSPATTGRRRTSRPTCAPGCTRAPCASPRAAASPTSPTWRRRRTSSACASPRSTR